MEALLGLLDPKAFSSILVLAVLIALETAIPLFVGRRGRVHHNAKNFAIGLFNVFALGALFAIVFRWQANVAGEQEWGILGLLDAPLWLETALAFVLFDAWMYCWHRANHEIKFLWRFHRAHHTDTEMDASTAVRFHPVEIVFSSLLRLLIIPLIGLSLGQLALYESLLLPVILIQHANFRMPFELDTALRVVFVTPWMHWVHHSELQPETDSNYSSLFSWCDRIGGTFRLRSDPGAINYGLAEFRESRWLSLWGFLRTPFRRL